MGDVFFGFMMGVGAAGLLCSLIVGRIERGRTIELLIGIDKLKTASDRAQRGSRCILSENDEWGEDSDESGEEDGDGEDLEIG